VRERVVELGEVPKTQLEALYSAAHALLFPSLAEGFGWPALEAQACACPVVCSNRTSLPEVVGNAAFMNDPDDEPAFARSLMQLFDPRLRLGAIQAGLENVSRQSTERMIANYCAIYSSLAGRS
jgi:glycosyltransferase involved in cell wall biosynthesis